MEEVSGGKENVYEIVDKEFKFNVNTKPNSQNSKYSQPSKTQEIHSSSTNFPQENSKTSEITKCSEKGQTTSHKEKEKDREDEMSFKKIEYLIKDLFSRSEEFLAKERDSIINALNAPFFWIIIDSLYFPRGSKPEALERAMDWLEELKGKKITQEDLKWSARDKRDQISSSNQEIIKKGSNPLDSLISKEEKALHKISQSNESNLKSCLSRMKEMARKDSYDAQNTKYYPNKTVKEEFSRRNEGLIPKKAYTDYSEFMAANETGCCVCNSCETNNDNVLIICSGCGLMVHRVCFGMDAKLLEESGDDDWYCPSCSMEIFVRKLWRYDREKCGTLKDRVFSSMLPIFQEPGKNIATQKGIDEALASEIGGRSETLENFKSLKEFINIPISKEFPFKNEFEEREEDYEIFKISGIVELPSFSHQMIRISKTCPLCPCSGGLLCFSRHRFNTEYFRDKNQFYFNANAKMGESLPLWFHLSCAKSVAALRLPYNGKFRKIRNISNISPLSFHKRCSICGLERNGVAIKCPVTNCRVYFHPECARRAYKACVLGIDSRLKFFCEDHRNCEMNENFVLAIERAAEVLSCILSKDIRNHSKPLKPIANGESIIYKNLSELREELTVSKPPKKSRPTPNEDDSGSEGKLIKKQKTFYANFQKEKPRLKRTLVIYLIFQRKRIVSTSSSFRGFYRIQAAFINTYEVFCRCLNSNYGLMVECERCRDWLHYSCLFPREKDNFDKEKSFKCKLCSEIK